MPRLGYASELALTCIHDQVVIKVLRGFEQHQTRLDPLPPEQGCGEDRSLKAVGLASTQHRQRPAGSRPVRLEVVAHFLRQECLDGFRGIEPVDQRALFGRQCGVKGLVREIHCSSGFVRRKGTGDAVSPTAAPSG